MLLLTFVSMLVLLLAVFRAELSRLRAELASARKDVEVRDGLLRKAVDHLGTTSGNSNWPTSVTSTPFFAKGLRLADGIVKTLGWKSPEETPAAESVDVKADADAVETAEPAAPASSPDSQPAPSKDGKGKPEKRKPRHPGTSQRRYDPDKVVEIRPEKCPHCHGTDLEPLGANIFQVLDLVIRMVVTHYRIGKARCRHCGKVFEAPRPHECSSGFGPGLTAFTALLTCLGMTRRKIGALVSQTTGVAVSQGGIQRMIDRSRHVDSIAEAA